MRAPKLSLCCAAIIATAGAACLTSSLALAQETTTNATEDEVFTTTTSTAATTAETTTTTTEATTTATTTETATTTAPNTTTTAPTTAPAPTGGYCPPHVATFYANITQVYEGAQTPYQWTFALTDAADDAPPGAHSCNATAFVAQYGTAAAGGHCTAFASTKDAPTVTTNGCIFNFHSSAVDELSGSEEAKLAHNDDDTQPSSLLVGSDQRTMSVNLRCDPAATNGVEMSRLVSVVKNSGGGFHYSFTGTFAGACTPPETSAPPPTTTQPPTTTPRPTYDDSDDKKELAVPLAAGISGLVFLCGIMGFTYYKYRAKKKASEATEGAVRGAVGVYDANKNHEELFINDYS